MCFGCSKQCCQPWRIRPRRIGELSLTFTWKVTSNLANNRMMTVFNDDGAVVLLYLHVDCVVWCTTRCFYFNSAAS